MRTKSYRRRQPPHYKHVPQRTCVGCRTTKAKRELIRLVHTGNGSVEVDAEGKKAGRGAYLCHRQSCWEVGLKKNRLEYALRTKLSVENLQTLREYAKTLPEEAS